HPDIRRRLRGAAVALGLVGTLLAMPVSFAAPAAGAGAFTAWGWPQPYEQGSEKSIAWLKEKGWWPLTVAWQPPFSGQNASLAVINGQGLLAKRGLEARFEAFNSGPDINEAVTSGRAQVGNGGNFPLTTLIDKRVPIKVVGITAPNLKHQTIVPNDSPLHTLKDLKGSNPPAVIGIVTGSSAEFYFQIAAAHNGLEIGKDVILKNLPLAEQIQLPKGIAAVVPWDLTASLITQERKTGRAINVSYPFNIYQGSYYLRTELVEQAPDVAQALTDALIEANLWIRQNPDQAADLLAAEANLKNVPKSLLRQQIDEYNNLYKPTVVYPTAAFWGQENVRIAQWLTQAKRLTRSLTAADYETVFAPQFAEHAFARLGWKVPTTPPYIGADWPGKLGQLPYPPYDTYLTLKAPQPFPEQGDLTNPWEFAGRVYAP
ncbi:ABC transporter substrate-binding protein, partial [uncultured Thiodictyon sp.]|uniref:ABC transporter substrate-binding protein n=1 Tax=uncultured Thiodictyon sp. TaxID=1846217 RepID=UPI0025EFA667